LIEDVFIVPVSISYDKLVDGNFNKEQMVQLKIALVFELYLSDFSAMLKLMFFCDERNYVSRL
jgi:hypothetical protein